jgi:hypothetical protein
MCNSPFCGENTFNRAMSDAYAAGQESVIEAVTDALKDVLDAPNVERLRNNLPKPEFFAQAVADLIALATLDGVRLTKRQLDKKQWKMGFWTGRSREREYVLDCLEQYARDPGNLLLRGDLFHIRRITSIIDSEPIKPPIG